MTEIFIDWDRRQVYKDINEVQRLMCLMYHTLNKIVKCLMYVFNVSERLMYTIGV